VRSDLRAVEDDVHHTRRSSGEYLLVPDDDQTLVLRSAVPGVPDVSKLDLLRTSLSATVSRLPTPPSADPTG
jgi:hypothetical protein